LGLPLALHYRAQSVYRASDEALRDQAGQLADLAADNDQLSNLLAQAKDSSPRSTDEAVLELMRLRGEIGPLRAAAREADRLRAMNQQLQAQPRGPGAAAGAEPPDPGTLLARWPKNELAFAGTAEPVAALKTALWGLSSGQTQALAAVLSPEALERIMWDKDHAAAKLSESASHMADSLAPATSFDITRPSAASADRAVLEVYFQGEGRSRKVALRKIGNEWKFDRLGLAGGSEEDLEHGAGWP
jgi:hypothetical protein